MNINEDAVAWHRATKSQSELNSRSGKNCQLTVATIQLIRTVCWTHNTWPPNTKWLLLRIKSTNTIPSQVIPFFFVQHTRSRKQAISLQCRAGVQNAGQLLDKKLSALWANLYAIFMIFFPDGKSDCHVNYGCRLICHPMAAILETFWFSDNCPSIYAREIIESATSMMWILGYCRHAWSSSSWNRDSAFFLLLSTKMK